jgi:glutamyl endopeptidase
MEIRRALVIVLTVALCVGLQSAAVRANPLEQAVADDGSQLVILQPQGAEVMRAEPFKGTGVRTPEALIAEGVIPEQPSIEAIRGLKPLAGGAGIESVIGSDTRIRTYTTYYPARATVLITNTTDGFFCTGFLIGSNTVATAGHCVHTGGTSGHWYTRAGYKVYPGKNYSSSPYGYCTAKTLYSVNGWTRSKNEEYDYAAIKLNCTVGNTVGWFGFYWQSTSLTNHPSIVPGYPGDKTGSLAYTQWWGSDTIRYTTFNQLFYNNDTYGGMSGSPVWEDKLGSPLPDSDGPYAMAIHGYGVHGAYPHNSFNHGRRINQAAYNNYITWKNAP